MTTKKKWFGTWPAKCDLCGRELEKSSWFVDGRMACSSSWALMCSACFHRIGVGLGIGKGQRYDSNTLEKIGG
jgi:hypothetical protein